MLFTQKEKKYQLKKLEVKIHYVNNVITELQKKFSPYTESLDLTITLERIHTFIYIEDCLIIQPNQ